jgi:hypothetical protein
MLPLSLLRKILSEVTPGLHELNREAHLAYPGHNIAEISFAIMGDRRFTEPLTLAIESIAATIYRVDEP